MKECKKCEQKYEDGNFCQVCGSKLVEIPDTRVEIAELTRIMRQVNERLGKLAGDGIIEKPIGKKVHYSKPGVVERNKSKQERQARVDLPKDKKET